ncbi:hypothetical protein FRC10_000477 [Ceratobasidium sp. 414]|nr:hypothetical protein FRC10_000477 [Ceratobasidium sp. 414]
MPSGSKGSSSFFQAPSLVLRATVSGAWRATKPPLPGLAEVEEAMRSWISSIKALRYDDERCQLLAKRIERVLGIVQEFKTARHPGLGDLVK